MSVPVVARRVAGDALRRYRASGLSWHLKNLRPELDYRLTRVRLSTAAATVTASLDRDGIAMIAANELVAPSLIAELLTDVARWEQDRNAEIQAVRIGEDTAHYKSRYRYSLLGLAPKWDPSSTFARFSLAPAIQEIANAYFGLRALLRYYNVWRTFPVTDPPSDSQLWHRDQEDRYILKVFLYLSNVTSDAGPLSYIPGTHKKGVLRLSPETFKESGHGNLRTRDDQMEKVVSKSRWREAVGDHGSLVFVDTAGFHKGGFSRSKERNVFTCMYTSPACTGGDLFDPTTPVSR